MPKSAHPPANICTNSMSFKFTDLIIMIRKPIVFPLTSAAPLKASRRSFDSAYPLANICTNSMSFKFHELNHHDKETNSISPPRPHHQRRARSTGWFVHSDSTHPMANTCTNSMSFRFHKLNHKETSCILPPWPHHQLHWRRGPLIPLIC